MTYHRDQVSRFAVAALSLAASVFFVDARADVVYSSLTTPLPNNLPSLGYEATSTSEFGDHVQPIANGQTLQNVTVTLSNWATASQYNGNGLGYTQSLTFNIYNYSSGTDSVGSLIGSETIDAFIPWRPEASASCTGGQAGDYVGSDGECHGGVAQNVVFDFSSLGIVLPSDIVFGLAFNTADYGADPTHTAGPYNSLNFALSSAATVGTDVNPDGVFWNTSYQGFLTTGTAGSFNEDTGGWEGLVPAVQFVTAAAAGVPEPSSITLLGIAGAGLLVARRRRAVRA